MSAGPGPLHLAAPLDGGGGAPRIGKAAGLSVMDRIYALRDRLLARPGFQRWVARFPLTRGFARRKERALFDIIAGFVHTQVLTASVRVGLLDALRDGPLGLEAIAARIKLTPEATARLVKAAASLDLLSQRAVGRYGLGDLGAAVAATPAFATVIEHNAIFYSDIADPVRLLRGDFAHTRLSAFWAYAHSADPQTLEPAAIADYTAFMAASQALIADDVLDAYPMGRHRALIDVGGGDGTFIAAAGARAPHLQLTLFDLPAVAARAEARLAKGPLSHRLRIVGGSFLDDELPSGADVATLNRVLLDHDDRTALRILAAVHRALEPGGTLLVAETLAGAPAADAYFGFYLMAMGRGSSRSFDELRRLIVEAGFGDVKPVPTFRTTLTGLISAVKPGRPSTRIDPKSVHKD